MGFLKKIFKEGNNFFSIDNVSDSYSNLNHEYPLSENVGILK